MVPSTYTSLFLSSVVLLSVADPSTLDDTIVDVTDDDKVFAEVSRSKRHVPSVLSEIMGPLSRSKRQVQSEFVRSDLVYSRMRVLHLMLKYLIGPNGPEVEIRHFVNWDKTILIDNLFYVHPTTIQQVQRIIRVAAMMQMRVRATGEGHSRSPLYPDEGNIMMDVRDLTRFDGPRIELMRPNSERQYYTVKAMTGVYLYDLNEFFVKNGVTLIAEPLNNNETIGGMVSVSTHGSTWNGTGFGDFMVEVRIIDSMGRLRRFVREQHSELFKSLNCGLGMFGIMYDITLRVVTSKVVKVENRIVSLESILYNATKFGEIVTSNLATEISWYPFNSLTNTEAEEYANSSKVPGNWSARRDYLWLRTTNEVDGVNPSLIQGPNFLPTGGSLSGSNVTGLLRGKSALDLVRNLSPVTYHYLPDAFPILKPPRFGTETSTALFVTVDTEYKRPLTALQFLIEFTERQIRSNGTTPINALLPRLLMNSDCHICPANSNIQPVNSTGRSMVIDFLAPPSQAGYYDISREFVYRFRGDLVRPHWAKRFDNMPGVMDIIRNVYGDGIQKFMKSREDYRLDPCDLFMNKYLLQIFGQSKIC
ncbi:hypothetical protein CHS0354_022659 [Potamilus streckersoni]|uniref:FAD-binding PCMH-type domain-containing protein n=1 Tax=Potamilus streckersoni TaxID=2493646 RepID=A0AAE0WDP9_9BIVA|nr:hypothetical protein CHS0354_022659 [Potamilus streckersoni]